jgi:AraC-like DNA-binding protein
MVLASAFFFASASGGTVQIKAPAPKPAISQTATPLFSVPGPPRVDSASHAVVPQKVPAVQNYPALRPASDSSVAHRAVINGAITPPKNLIEQPAHDQKNHRRGHRMSDVFDLRYGILILSIIIIGAWLQFTLKKANQPAFVTTTRLSIMDKEVQTACRYIEKNFKNTQLSLETVCEALVTGKAFLNALFKQELGLSVEDFIIQVRINRARMLIEKNTSVDAQTAASETGFEDVSAFAESFHSIVGAPFEQYRDSRAKNVA